MWAGAGPDVASIKSFRSLVLAGTAATRNGRGYWLLSEDGSAYRFDAAPTMATLAGRSR